MAGRKVPAGARGMAGPANDVGKAPAFTLTSGELQALMAAAVREALRAGEGAPLLIDKQILAHRLGVSAAHIDNLRKRGLPTVMVGEAVRFEPARVLTWLRSQGDTPPNE